MRSFDGERCESQDKNGGNTTFYIIFADYDVTTQSYFDTVISYMPYYRNPNTDR